MADSDRRSFYKEFTRAIAEGSAALFIGAGLSRAAGFVNWAGLLKEIAEELDLDVHREADLVALAQFHLNHQGGRAKLNQLLIDEFLEDVEETENHRIIAALPVGTIWTTNYDRLIEQAIENMGKRVDVKRRQDDFAYAKSRAHSTVYKMHGDKESPNEAVLTKEDYEAYDDTREMFTIALKGDLTTKTFLFLGISFADPNIMYLLSRVRQLAGRDGRTHYCLLKRPESDGTEPSAYQVKRFQHWVADLKRYNIQPIIIDRYEEVTEVLSELRHRSGLRNVFISGAAKDFAPLGQDRFDELCRQLGAALIREGFNLVSGYGLGVGGSVVVGALQTLQHNDDQRLQLWPFPQHVPDDVDRAAMWTSYRERMLSGVGVCIVLSGNKEGESGPIERSEGVIEEVEIAKRNGAFVLPIGATGHIAKELWDEANDGTSHELSRQGTRKHWETIGDSSHGVSELVESTVAILKALEN